MFITDCSQLRSASFETICSVCNTKNTKYFLQRDSTVCSLKHPWLVVTQKLPVSTLLKVESRPEFAQDHESGLRSDRGPVVLCDFSKLRFWKSPYDFLNLYGRFCPYNPPYNPGHDTLPSNLHIEIFTQRKKTRRKSIGFLKAYRFTLRKPGLEISFRM